MDLKALCDAVRPYGGKLLPIHIRKFSFSAIAPTL